MAVPHAVSALEAKRAEVRRAIAAAERRLAQLRADLIHLDATLRLFQSEAAPDDDAPERATWQRRWFRNGELARRTLDALRTAGAEPLGTVEIAARVMTAKGLDPDDVPARILVRRGVSNYLRERAKDGLVRRVAVPGSKRDARWRLDGVAAAE